MSTPNITNLMALANYDMQEHDSVNYQKENHGTLLAVDKNNGALVQLDAALFTKWNFLKKKFGRGPLKDYRVSLPSIREAVRLNFVNQTINSLDPQIRDRLYDQISIISDKHGNYDRLDPLFTETAFPCTVTINAETVAQRSNISKKEFFKRSFTFQLPGCRFKANHTPDIPNEVAKAAYEALALEVGYYDVFLGVKRPFKNEDIQNQVKNCLRKEGEQYKLEGDITFGGQIGDRVILTCT